MVTDIHFRAATTDERERCARAMAESDPWLAYQRSIEWCRYVLNWPGSELFVPANGELLGFLLLHAKAFWEIPISPRSGSRNGTEQWHGRADAVICRRQFCRQPFRVLMRIFLQCQGKAGFTSVTDTRRSQSSPISLQMAIARY